MNIKRSLAVLLTAVFAVLMTGCANYKKLAQNEPVEYLSTVFKNTFKSISEKDMLDISSQAYNAVHSGTVTVSADFDSVTGSFSMTNGKKDQYGYGFDISGSGETISGNAVIDKDGVGFSAQSGSDSYKYTIPFENFENKFRNSIWGSDSNSSYSLSTSMEDSIIDYVKEFRDSYTSKNDTEIIKQLKKLDHEFEESDSTASDGTYKAYIISYDLSSDDLVDLIEGFSDGGVIDSYDYRNLKDTIRENEITLKLSFEINKKTNTLIAVSSKLKANDGTVISANLDIGGDPKKNNEYKLKLNASDDDDSIEVTVSFLVDEDTKNSEIYTTKMKFDYGYENIELKAKTEYDKKSREFSTKVTLSEGSEEYDVKCSGTVNKGKKESSITIDSIGGDLGELFSKNIDLDGSITFTFSSDNSIKKIDGKNFLDISEDDLEQMTDSFSDSLKNIFGQTKYVSEEAKSSANFQAKCAHTAISSAVTMLGIYNFDFGVYNNATSASFGAPNSNGVIEIVWDGVSYTPDDDDVDLVSYLGESFDGYAYVVFNPDTYSVQYALWSQDPIPEKYKHRLTEDEIDQSARKGSVVGCYPILT